MYHCKIKEKDNIKMYLSEWVVEMEDNVQWSTLVLVVLNISVLHLQR